MPIDGQRLIIEPSYPWAEALSKIGTDREPETEEDRGWRVRNSWYSIRRRGTIVIIEKDGKITYGLRPGFHHISYDLQTLGCSEVWGLDQEHRALNLLGTMVRHHQMRQYVLTGMFLETSARSGVTYLFRRLKPTIAAAAGKKPEDSMRILAALCQHPIAYYDGSWAGAMCPTDDVVAHLAMMRGDEHMLWKRSNQHPPFRPEAGL